MYAGVQLAKDLGVPVTLHAGEWPNWDQTKVNLRFAVNELAVSRVGHGLALSKWEAAEVDQVAKEKNFTVEVSQSVRH